MHQLDLSSLPWTFHEPRSRRWLPARVPGCIHADLLRHRLIPDPFRACNELGLQWIGQTAWTYRAEFKVPEAFHTEEHLDLVLEGLDTVATIKLNGKPLLRSDNMFHIHRLPVKQLLRRGTNRLEAAFHSAEEYIRTHRTEFTTKEYNDPVGGAVRIRKQQCQFGWDWGPRFITAGFWRPVRLEAWSANRFASVRIAQEHKADRVFLTIHSTLDTRTPASLRGRVRFQGRTVAEFDGSRAVIPRPRLWWPAGQGDQPLYDVELELVSADGTVLDTWKRRIGLRTIVLDQEPDAFHTARGGSHPMTRFGFRVNGRLIFAKGANWIPAHSFAAGLGRTDYEPLLQSAVQAHMNMIRLWGGGIYEHDAFYDLCDELGLLVWHDHMFACNRYPADAPFLKSVEREVRDHVRRIRHHACLALWCGNNETVMLNWEGTQKGEGRRGYARLFLDTIPRAVRAEDPATPYIHSSPLHNIQGLTRTHSPSRDEHDWDVWHARKPVEHYLTKEHRFLSEFGMQSFPSPAIAATFCPPEELDIFSPTFQNHQKNRGGNGIILDYVTRLYRLPRHYAGLAYLSQLNQAYCMKTAVEHFRRLQPLCLGTLYWQLNDCWPVASWSSLEFSGRWKVLHHAARRFFAPSLVSARHLGEDTVTIGNYPRNTKGAVEIWTSHDAPAPRRARLAWRLLTFDGKTLLSGHKAILLRPLQSVLQKTLDCTPHLEGQARAHTVLHLTLDDARTGELLSENTVLFAAPRMLDLRPALFRRSWKKTAPDTWTLTLSSRHYQHGIWLEMPDGGASASDNAFDLLPGIPKTVTFRVRPGEGRPAPVFHAVHHVTA